MQKVSEVMTRDVRSVSLHENVQRAAQMMGELDVGALPVCDGDRLVGMVTDRDITLRSTAAGRPPQEAHIEEVMSRDVRWCFEDQPLDEVMIQMADSQVRRVPVVSHDEHHTLVGIVALGDIATRTTEGPQKADVEQVVEMVSAPSQTRQKQEPTGNGAAAGKSEAGGSGSGAGAEGGDVDAVYAGQADAGDTSFDEDPGAGSISAASDDAGALPGNVSLADGTGTGASAIESEQAGTGQSAGSAPASSAGSSGEGPSGADADGTENMRSGPT